MNGVVLLIYGDSLALPRVQDGISCFDTYPELLRQMLEAKHPDTRVAVFNRSRGGAPIAELLAQFTDDSAYLGAEQRRILVIQCGIVDCAPRPVPLSVKAGIGRLPTPLRWGVARALHYARPLLLRSGLAWRNTDRAAFAETLNRWIARAGRIADRVYVINIAPTTPEMDGHSPGLAASIEDYNAATSEVVAATASSAVRLIDVHGAISSHQEGLVKHVSPTDGHHITREGHRLYAGLIAAQESEEAAQ